MMLSIVALITNTLPAQTWTEWFQQKKTQKQYLLQQIAALKVYAGYLSEGYLIVQNGLGLIQDIKKGDFSLHNNYFNSLVSVNPAIKRYSKVAAIIAIQLSIAKQTNNAIKNFSKANLFTDTEISYFKNVITNLLADCSKALDELYLLTTSGNLQMKDDERIKAIDGLYADMQDKQMFSQAFCTEATGLVVQRSREEYEMIISKQLNGIK